MKTAFVYHHYSSELQKDFYPITTLCFDSLSAVKSEIPTDFLILPEITSTIS